ncbi:hypothetical protein OAH87_04165 [Marinomonas sp.]|nr:hypothetical protein [Marinomonas sp.]MDB4837643.1 hypothetical protein [Marinomonas sp.]
MGGGVVASATVEEFVPCQKLAVAKLEYCLKGGGDACWERSEASFNTCYQRVIQSHDRNSAALRAERDARLKVR